MMRSLEYQGVKTLFGYPGGSIMPTFDALYGHRDKLNHILVRHEQGAAHAAQGFARSSGEVGVCLVTSGRHPREHHLEPQVLPGCSDRRYQGFQDHPGRVIPNGR